MRLVWHSLCLCGVILLPIGAWAADKSLSPADETPAEKLRQALDRVRDLEIADQPLDAAVNQLRELTGLNIVLDRAAVPSVPSSGFFTGLPLPSYGHLRIGGQFHGIPLRAALTKLLRTHNLTHVLVGDTVYITTAEKATDRQLGQKVSISVDKMPLRDALKRLSRDTGANVVLDPRATEEARTALTLHLDEVPLETAVELLADEAGLQAVRMSNVLYVTIEARAEKLRKSHPVRAAAPAAGWRVWPAGNGGFRLTPPAGASIGGGGMGGIAGFNQLGAMGGFAGSDGVAKPVPLTPPLPKVKQPTPAKPKQDKPVIEPAGKNKARVKG